MVIILPDTDPPSQQAVTAHREGGLVEPIDLMGQLIR